VTDGFTCEPLGPRFDLPVESKSGESPRTPSVVSRTCEPKPTGQCHAYFLSFAWLRAPIHLLSTRAPRQAVLRASFWLAPCLVSPRGLATSRRTRRAMRPIDFCYPYKLRVPVTSCVSGIRYREFPRVGASPSLGSMRLDRRSVRFHDARTALVDRQDPLSPECCLRSLSPPKFVFRLGGGGSVGVFFPRSPRTTVPLTPLSPLPLPPAVSPAFAVSWPARLF